MFPMKMETKVRIFRISIFVRVQKSVRVRGILQY